MAHFNNIKVSYKIRLNDQSISTEVLGITLENFSQVNPGFPGMQNLKNDGFGSPTFLVLNFLLETYFEIGLH